MFRKLRTRSHLTVTGRIQSTGGDEQEIRIEVLSRPDGDLVTLVAYDQNAVALQSYLIPGNIYTIDYEPRSGQDYDGEAFSARVPGV